MVKISERLRTAAGLIGEGEHERFIIFEDKFQAKTDAKLNK